MAVDLPSQTTSVVLKTVMAGSSGKLGTLSTRWLDFLNYHVFHRWISYQKILKYTTLKPFLSFTDSEGTEYYSINRNGKWCFWIHFPKYTHSHLKGPGPRKDGRISPHFKADCTEQGACSPEGISDFVPTSISCNNYGLSSTILSIIPVTFGILDLLASAGKRSGEAELFKYGPKLNGIGRGRSCNIWLLTKRKCF